MLESYHNSLYTPKEQITYLLLSDYDAINVTNIVYKCWRGVAFGIEDFSCSGEDG